MNLPQPLENESIGDYIKRLVSEKLITASQIPLAIKKYNSK